MPNLKGKVALITGASSGIGAGTAIYFASLGCNLALTARNETKMLAVVQQCIQQGITAEQVITVMGDITVEGVAEEVVRKTVEHFGKLDILVNNAGLSRITLASDQSSIAHFDLIFNTNLKAPFRMIQLCVPHLKISKGNIINVSSAAALKPVLSAALYGASKAALDYLTKTVALELAPDIRVNSVNPGGVKTDIYENSGMKVENIVERREWIKNIHALGRIAEPEEIAKAIAFLASDDASFVTGSIFLVDGGFALTGPKIK